MMIKMILTIKTKLALVFFALLIVGCAPTKKPIEFEFERSYINDGYYQALNYSGIKIIRDEKVYNYSFGDFKDFANSVEAIIVNDLDDDNEIDILLKLSACGANCSGNYQILFYDPNSDQYISTKPLARETLETLDYSKSDSSKNVYVTRDDDFISIFYEPIAGIGPIQILIYKDKRFQDITNEYPQIVEEDAKYWEARIKNTDIDMTEEYSKITGIQNYRKSKQDERLQILYLASYISDVCLLDKCEQGWAMLNNHCRENQSMDIEACKRLEESIKLALKTRKVLK